jgi:N-acetylneuraminate synthase
LFLEIVPDYGFKEWEPAAPGEWSKLVFEVYQSASIPFEDACLEEECDKAGLDYFSAPYDFED